MRKFLLLLSVSVFLIGIVYASPFYPQSKTLDFKESCTSAGAICNSSALCNVSIKYPNLSYVINNGVMTNNNNAILIILLMLLQPLRRVSTHGICIVVRREYAERDTIHLLLTLSV